MYNLANGNDNIGTVDYIPIPPLSSEDWDCACTDIIAACQLKIRIDVHNAMKPSTGSKDVHLSWFIPFNVFAQIFALCEATKKTKITYQMRSLDKCWMNKSLGDGWDVKKTILEDTIECKVTVPDVTFR